MSPRRRRRPRSTPSAKNPRTRRQPPLATCGSRSTIRFLEGRRRDGLVFGLGVGVESGLKQDFAFGDVAHTGPHRLVEQGRRDLEIGSAPLTRPRFTSRRRSVRAVPRTYAVVSEMDGVVVWRRIANSATKKGAQSSRQRTSIHVQAYAVKTHLVLSSSTPIPWPRFDQLLTQSPR